VLPIGWSRFTAFAHDLVGEGHAGFKIEINSAILDREQPVAK